MHLSYDYGWPFLGLKKRSSSNTRLLWRSFQRIKFCLLRWFYCSVSSHDSCLTTSSFLVHEEDILFTEDVCSSVLPFLRHATMVTTFCYYFVYVHEKRKKKKDNEKKEIQKGMEKVKEVHNQVLMQIRENMESTMLINFMISIMKSTPRPNLVCLNSILTHF